MSVAAGGQSEDAETGEGVIYVAASLPITGDYAEYGDTFKKSIGMGLDSINDSGGVLGRKVEVLFGDSKADPKESATLAQKYTADSKIVAVIGDFTSTCSLAGQPIYNDRELVQLSPTSSHPDFAPGSKWSFSIIGTMDSEGPFMARYSYGDLGFRKVAVLYTNNDWGIVTKDYFTNEFERQGGQVVGEQFVFDGEKDFTAVLTKLKATKPDLLFITAMYNDGALINKQRVKLNWDVPVLAPGSIFSPKYIELGGEAVEGTYTNVMFFHGDPRPEVQAFVEEFEQRAGRKPDMFAAVGYDCITLLADAIERAGSTDRNAIRESLADTQEFPGIAGRITFTPDGDIKREYTRLIVKDGQFQVY
jgi:branched-chain amino acid transport system substrate-binding protein